MPESRSTRRTFDPKIAETDWLQHRWHFEIKSREMQGQTSYYVSVGGCDVSRHKSAAGAKKWIEEVRIRSLADVIASHPHLHPILVYIDAAPGGRLRIPPELWATYDALDQSWGDNFLVLSAKARAMFPEHASHTFIRGKKVDLPPRRRR